MNITEKHKITPSMGKIFTVCGYNFSTGELQDKLEIAKAVSKEIVIYKRFTSREFKKSEAIKCPKQTNTQEFIRVFNERLSEAMLSNEEKCEFKVFGEQFFKPSSDVTLSIEEGYTGHIIINRLYNQRILMRRALDLPKKVSQNKFIQEFKKEYAKALEKQWGMEL